MVTRTPDWSALASEHERLADSRGGPASPAQAARHRAAAPGVAVTAPPAGSRRRLGMLAHRRREGQQA
jgi:hypothetical protein